MSYKEVKKFSNRCTICGAFFDENDICQNGHQLGGIVDVKSTKTNYQEKDIKIRKNKNKKKLKKMRL